MNDDATITPSKVLILGGRGRLGLAVARAFARQGWQVVCQVRPEASLPTVGAVDPAIQWLALDLNDIGALARAASGATVVVHALNPPYTNQAWRNQALVMLERSIEITRALGGTLMLPGNIYNFGAEMPAVLREDTPQRASTVKGQIRIGMEAQLERSGVRAIVIRSGDFFGSGTGTWFDQVIVGKLNRGVLTYPGERDLGTAWAYLPDLARTFVAVAQRRSQLAAFEVFHFAGKQLTGQQWLEALLPLARAQGWVAPGATLGYRSLPWALIRLVGWCYPAWGSLQEMRYLWRTPYALANDKLVRLLGAEPHTPLALAARETLIDLGLMHDAQLARTALA